MIIVSSRDEGDTVCALSLIPLLQLCVLLQPRLSASASIEATFKSRDCKLCVCTIKRGRIFKAENRYETYPTRGGNIGGFPQQLKGEILASTSETSLLSIPSICGVNSFGSFQSLNEDI